MYWMSQAGSFCLIFLTNSLASLSPSRNFNAVTLSQSEGETKENRQQFIFIYCEENMLSVQIVIPVAVGRLNFKCICSVGSLRR